tara:strand:- start:2817 stop:3722 length:906 start_codon:yes stop_codon:yes gene_type:complete
MLNAGIIGCGIIAGIDDIKSNTNIKTHANAYRLNRNTKLINCFDTDSLKKKSFSKRWKCEASVNINDFFNKNLDIVSICTTTKFHYRYLKLSLKYNIPFIWLEKPSVLNQREYNEIEKLIKNSNSIVLLNYIRRFDSTYLQLGKFIKTIGGCTVININYTKGFFHNCSHFINLINFIFKSEVSILNIIKPNHKNNYFSPTVIGKIGNTRVNFIGHDYRNFEIIDLSFYGKKGKINLTNNGKTIEVLLLDKSSKYLKTKFIKNNLLNNYMGVALSNLINKKNLVYFNEDNSLFKYEKFFKTI